MKNILAIKDWVEIVGIFAIFVSLIFLLLQMRQEQELFSAENAINRLDILIELNNAIIANTEVWAAGNSGELLSEIDLIQYERLLNSYNEVTFMGYMSAQSQGIQNAGLSSIAQFASFLASNPAAFKAWNERELRLEKEREVIFNTGGPSGSIGQRYQSLVREYVDRFAREM